MKSKLIDLGFAEAHLPPGTHICQIYNDEDERNDSLLRFLLTGIESGECGACFSEDMRREELERYFRKFGVDLKEAEESGAFSLSKTSEVYFKDSSFDPQRMLDLLKNFYAKSLEGGFSSARVIGEMTSEINHVHGGGRLLEYESKVSLLLQEHPVTAVCQYNANKFSGAMVMDVLKVHPMMVVRGAVIHNPFYIPPEEYLKSC